MRLDHLLQRCAGAAAVLAPILLAACATPATPASQVAALPPPVERPPAAPRPPPPPRAVTLHWEFAAATDLCTADASGQGGTLHVQATPRHILMTVQFDAAAHPGPPRPRRATLRFRSSAGDWSVPGTWQRRAFSGEQALDPHGVASVLSLLAGGQAAVHAGPVQLGAVQVAAAGAEGGDWVQCPKGMMAPS